jgi:hypothetical protein
VLSSIYVKTWRYTAQYPCHYVRSLGAIREQVNACVIRATTNISKYLKTTLWEKFHTENERICIVCAYTYVEGVYGIHICDQVLKNE